jgi:hypothetical protein
MLKSAQIYQLGNEEITKNNKHKTVPAHNPGIKKPSKQVEDVQSAAPEKATFEHELPEGSAAEQSPTVSALESSSDASQGPSTTDE